MTLIRLRRSQLAVSLPIPPGTFGIDTMHTQLAFSVTHLGISTIRGTFDRFGGRLAVGEGLADTSLTIEAEMASINTGNTMRDEHMDRADFLDVANHSQMVFQSTLSPRAGSGYTLAGNLTIKGGDPAGDVQHDVQRFAGLPHGSVHALRVQRRRHDQPQRLRGELWRPHGGRRGRAPARGPVHQARPNWLSRPSCGPPPPSGAVSRC